jgi:hypothetical protein
MLSAFAEIFSNSGSVGGEKATPKKPDGPSYDKPVNEPMPEAVPNCVSVPLVLMVKI